MKKIILSALVLICLSFTINYSNNSNELEKQNSDSRQNESTVYICNGPKSYAYHSNGSCSGLNNCSTQIYAISLSEALNKGRRACQRCY